MLYVLYSPDRSSTTFLGTPSGVGVGSVPRVRSKNEDNRCSLSSTRALSVLQFRVIPAAATGAPRRWTMISCPSRFNFIHVEYDNHPDWPQGFRGGVLDKSESIVLRPQSRETSDFLGEFKSVALTTSIPSTLLKFSFITSRSWDPSYRSLLPFTQLKELVRGTLFLKG